MNSWGDDSEAGPSGPSVMDRGFPMPVPSTPFYAPTGPGPFTTPGAAPVHPPEQRHHRHRRHHSHQHHSPQVIVKREAPPVIPTVIPQVINQEQPRPNLVNPGFMNPNLVIPGQHRSTHEHTRHTDDRRSRTYSEGQRHGHSHGHSRSHSHGHGHGHNHNQSRSQTRGQSHNENHGRSRSHSRTPRSRANSSSRRPFFTSAAHVQPYPAPSPPPSEQAQRRGREPLLMMPPSTPIRLRLDSLSGQHAHLPSFQYSQCNGRKKALCIGINYRGQQNELKGCINDTRDIRNFLIRYWGYKSRNIVMLTDDARDQRQLPTRKNIIDAMRWLVRDARCHDALFFHYSGHGGQTKDLNGDEIDGYDEVIFPLDFARAGHILDDDMHTIMVKSLPQGCRLTAVFDSCHSGTALDLPYVYHSNGRLKGNQITPSARAAKLTSADVISWCACRDDQTSADTTEGGEAVGAMSYAFMFSLKQNPNQTYSQLLRSVRDILRKRYSQKSQLSSSHPIDTNLRFLL